MPSSSNGSSNDDNIATIIPNTDARTSITISGRDLQRGSTLASGVVISSSDGGSCDYSVGEMPNQEEEVAQYDSNNEKDEKAVNIAACTSTATEEVKSSRDIEKKSTRNYQANSTVKQSSASSEALLNQRIISPLTSTSTSLLPPPPMATGLDRQRAGYVQPKPGAYAIQHPDNHNNSETTTTTTVMTSSTSS